MKRSDAKPQKKDSEIFNEVNDLIQEEIAQLSIMQYVFWNKKVKRTHRFDSGDVLSRQIISSDEICGRANSVFSWSKSFFIFLPALS